MAQTQKDGDILLEEELETDPDAPRELGPSDPIDRIADEEAKGCRFLLVRRKVETIDLGNGAFGAIEIDCSLLPARALRFTYAQCVIKLEDPAGTAFVDIAPVQVSKPGTLRYAYKVSGKIFPLGPASIADAYVESKREVTYLHSQVQGAGGGNDRADWRFQEDPNARQGIDVLHTLFMTVPHTGRIGCKVSINARISRSGPAAGIRNLVFGKKVNQRWRSFQVDVPPSAASPPA